MTEAELKKLCSRENISIADAREALELVQTLSRPRPAGIGMPRNREGDVMEAAARLAGALHDDLSVGTHFFATVEEVVRLLKEL